MPQALAANHPDHQKTAIIRSTSRRRQKTCTHSNRTEKLYEIIHGNHEKSEQLPNCSMPYCMQLQDQPAEISMETSCEHAVEAETVTFNEEKEMISIHIITKMIII